MHGMSCRSETRGQGQGPTLFDIISPYMILYHITLLYTYMGSCQNYGPTLGPLNTRCHITLRTTINLTSIHVLYIYIYIIIIITISSIIIIYIT